MSRNFENGSDVKLFEGDEKKGEPSANKKLQI